ncbi:MAG: 3-isopropylmalate dehydratase small subunit [Bacilli bacterium]
MKPFVVHSGITAPLQRANIDTDAIIPKQFLKRIERTGFGQFLFYDWRYRADGTQVEDFVLAQSAYRNATILLAGPNFGCGSSREHAPWALLDYGFRAIIAPSFADIFYNNCFKNGVLPIVLPDHSVQRLFGQIESQGRHTLTIDLPAQEVRGEDGAVYPFEIDAYRKKCLLEGLDDIALTLGHEQAISAYETTARHARRIAPAGA